MNIGRLTAVLYALINRGEFEKVDTLMDTVYNHQKTMTRKLITEQTNELVKLMQQVISSELYPSIEASIDLTNAKETFIDWVMSKHYPDDPINTK